MITAVDTSVLLDVFGADDRFGPGSRDALQRALDLGALVACDVVWAETAGAFPSRAGMNEAMERLGVAFEPLSRLGAIHAGEAWGEYRRGGGARERVIADFLIGAHAAVQAERLLTRDRGFYRAYFGDLRIVDPTAGTAE